MGVKIHVSLAGARFELGPRCGGFFKHIFNDGPLGFLLDLTGLDRFTGANLFRRDDFSPTRSGRLFGHIRIHLSHTAFPAIKNRGSNKHIFGTD